MNYVFFIALLHLAFSYSKLTIPSQLTCIGPLSNPYASYMTGLASSSYYPTSSAGSFYYIPNIISFALATDQTVFPLMDRHLKSLRISFYRLAAAFMASTLTPLNYHLYYATDKGFLKCIVQSYPKLVYGFMGVTCFILDSSMIVTNNLDLAYA
jgi:hypothetical protein